ncbi:type II toxin-antitoxin system RelE/ParE family toxin [Halotia wernerae UHCC 0503]|nr:type II toxin-antitoxin system RelE/ParE family toxin [Halotia wernerae UHCC 0503]
MIYRVKITPTALADTEAFYLWLLQSYSINAAVWFNGLFEAINTLTSMPGRCPIAPETEIVRQEIRFLLYAKHYRILYSVKGNSLIYHIRHTSQQWMTRQDFLEELYTDIATDETEEA